MAQAHDPRVLELSETAITVEGSNGALEAFADRLGIPNVNIATRVRSRSHCLGKLPVNHQSKASNRRA
jgi:hypothetical protein